MTPADKPHDKPHDKPADQTKPAEPHNAQADARLGETSEQPAQALQNEYTGPASRDGIPANGSAPVAARGPDDVGA